MLPTPRWLAGLAACSLLPLLAASGREAWLLVLVADLLWVLCWWIDLRATPTADAVEVQRDAPTTWSAGRLLTAQYRWRLRSGRVRRIEVIERVPAPLDTGVDAVRVLVPVLGQWIDESIDRTPAHRGAGDGGALHVRLQGPWGLAERQGCCALPWRLVVLPALEESVRALPTARRRREAGQRPERIIGEGRDFDGMREWVVGDDTRTLDWKATARRGKPIVRRYRDERRQPVLLMLDAGRLMAAEHEGRSRFDAAVAAVAALACAAHAHEDDVGLVIFDTEPRVVLMPMRGRAGLRRVLEALAAAVPRLVEPDYPRAMAEVARRQRRRALVALFTDVIDGSASAALVQQARTLRPRHLPVVITLRDPALELLAVAAPTSVRVAYARAAAEALVDARAVALDRMRADGIVVVDAAAEGAARAVVAAYERLKRRGVL